MEKVFTHYGFQTSQDRSIIEKAMQKIGINSFEKFSKDEDGLYFMSINPISTADLDDFTTQELIDELENRGIDYVY